jgi:Zn-dependent membrane protease YugP
MRFFGIDIGAQVAPTTGPSPSNYTLAVYHLSDAGNGTATFEKAACTFDQITNATLDSQCVLTNLARFTAGLTTSMPLFGLIFYFATWAFIGVFFLSLLVVFWCKPYEGSPHNGDDELEI